MAEAESQAPEEILQRMRTIRTRLDNEMTGVVQNARQLVDWRYYYEKWPWLSLSAAVAAGFLVVRPQPNPLVVDPAIGKALANNDRVVVHPRRKTVMDTLSGLVITTLFRTCVNGASHWFGNAVRRESSARHHPPREIKT